MIHRLPLVGLALLLTGSAHATDSRAAFLKLIDHPRVELAAEAKSPVTKDGLTEIAFSFAAEATQRVPGILVKTEASSGRRPVVIALHGTGGTKESQRPFLGQVARDGFVPVAKSPVTKDGLTKIAFSFAAEATQRVPGKAERDFR